MDDYEWSRRPKEATTDESVDLANVVDKVVNPIIVDGYASLFNCTTAVRASDSMMASS